MSAPTTTGPAAPAPAGFGSYAPSDVTWLLTDLSDVDLEVSTGERESLIQSGRHYFEMLPVEYQPEPSYMALYEQALALNAHQVARAIATVSDRVLTWHQEQPPVLVSLARAGTPIGILMRRWWARHGVDVPHYTVSIVRGGGIDTVALDWLLERYPASRLQFVDGWTGKGAIVRELAEAIADYRQTRPGAADLSGELAVLADPGGCTALHGTREDFLIPSSCLNSTVSGLVSRTVYRTDLIGPGMFHGAKFYAHLRDADVSVDFIEQIEAEYATVRVTDSPYGSAPTWNGWAAVEQVAAEHGITNLNLVKPGLGETTRVLLRRVPWQILMQTDLAGHPSVAHIEQLAADRGVPVVLRDDLPYAVIGLIRPSESDQ